MHSNYKITFPFRVGVFGCLRNVFTYVRYIAPLYDIPQEHQGNVQRENKLRLSCTLELN